ncbi:hypothetical protein B0H13DRAFT_1587135, partial [Mycena leptocephala]
QLVKNGPYNYMRHPSYTGALLAYIGLVIYYGSKGTWFRECVILGATDSDMKDFGSVCRSRHVTCGLLCRIPNEDKALKEKFGKEWDIWATEVPYVLIPKVH